MKAEKSIGHITMARMDKLLKITSLESVNYEALADIYETGMHEVLKEIAVEKFLNGERQKSYSPQEDRKLRDSYIRTFNALTKTLSAEQRALLIELDTICGEQVSFEGFNSFLSGFISGYRFLKSTQQSFKGEWGNV